MRNAFIALSAVLLLACGYSEDEWQAQLARYADLEAECAFRS